MDENEKYGKAYNPKEIADLLGIAPSTLRKWAKILEDHRYQFIRDDQNRRVYTDRDAIAFKMFSDLTKEKNIGLDMAADVVLQRFGATTQSVALSDMNAEERHINRYESLLETLLEKVENQEKFNQKLVERLDQQQKYLEESLNRRDKHLMEALREIQETKLLIAASKDKNESWWKRIFNK